MMARPFGDDIIEMTPEERRKALAEIMALGYSREAAERALMFATGETAGDLIV